MHEAMWLPRRIDPVAKGTQVCRRCIQVVDGARGHSITVRRQGWPDAVVWNPWTEKAQATGDFDDEEYQVRGCANGWVVPPT